MRKSRHINILNVLRVIAILVCLSMLGLVIANSVSSSASSTKKDTATILLKPAVVIPTTTTTIVPPTTTTAPPTTTIPVTTTTQPYIPPTTTVPPTTPVAPPVAVVVPSTGGDSTVYAQWTKVAMCEEGGWIGYAGPAYPNSLGINSTNWYANGGGSDMSPWAQIAVGQRIAAQYVYAGWVPDQNRCSTW